MGDEVSPVEVDGVQAWMLASDVREAREFTPQRSVRLIPAFDQYVIGASRHAQHLLVGAPRKCLLLRQGYCGRLPLAVSILGSGKRSGDPVSREH